jgi:hypothetical protein
MPKLTREQAKIFLLTQRKRNAKRRAVALVKVAYFNGCIMRKAKGGRCSEDAGLKCKFYRDCYNLAVNLNWPGWRLISKEEAEKNGLYSKTFYRTNDGSVQEVKEVHTLGTEELLLHRNCRSGNKSN